MDKVHQEVIGLSGGKKQFWLRNNRAEVEQYYFDNGPEATKQRFNMRPGTLEGFFQRKSREVKLTKLSNNDKWVYEAAMDRSRELSRRITALETWQEQVKPIIAVAQALINATMGQIKLQSCKITKKDDPLSLADFGGKLGK